MKDITLKITGRQISADNEADEMEFVTEGRMYEKNKSTYLIYDESEFSGFPGCRTALKFTGETVKMTRLGKAAGIGMEFIFEEGKRFSSEYRTPYGIFDMEVLTKSIDGKLSEDGTGKINIDYEVSFNGSREGRNELTIEVME